MQRNRRHRKPEPLEPFHPRTVTEPNRTEASLKKAKTLQVSIENLRKPLAPHKNYFAFTHTHNASPNPMLYQKKEEKSSSLGGRKTAQEKKNNSWERRFPGTFRTNVPLILPIFSVFSVGGGPKVPRNFVPGNFFFLF